MNLSNEQDKKEITMNELNCVAEKIIEVMIEKKESESKILETRNYLVDLNPYETIHIKMLLDKHGEISLTEKLYISYDELMTIRDVMDRIFWMASCEEENHEG
jgi:hypothetical protein